MKETIKKNIKEAIEKLNLKKEELDSITYGNLNKISTIANVDILEVMEYLRYERN